MLAVMELESGGFCPWAVSTKDAIGLGQIHWPAHGKQLIEKKIIKERRDLFNIDSNALISSGILEDALIKSNLKVVKALESYLGGQDGKYVLHILTNFTELSLQLEKR
jgi:hypothetical protein